LASLPVVALTKTCEKLKNGNNRAIPREMENFFIEKNTF
jgi:hypothetical protein